MTNKRVGWLLVPLCGMVLVGAQGVGSAHDEKSQGKSKVSFFDGRAWLGVRLSDVTSERGRELKLPGEYGAVIEKVEDDSPAAKAGLEESDVILAFADERVRSVAHLQRLVRETPPGRRVTLQVSRGGQTRSVEVVLEARRGHVLRSDIPLPRITIPSIEIPEFDLRIYTQRARLGISGDELTPQLAEYFGVKQGKGVLVCEVVSGSAAARAGLKAGDVIVRVDDEEVGSVGELRRALGAERESQEVMLTIVRDRKEQTLKVEPEEPQRFSPRRTARAEIENCPEL